MESTPGEKTCPSLTQPRNNVTNRVRIAPPTVYGYSRGGVGGVQVFPQKSAVTNLQTLFPRIQFFPDDQHVAVIQIVHGLHDARSLSCQRPTGDTKSQSPVAGQEFINTGSSFFTGILWQKCTHARWSRLPSLLCWWCEAPWRAPPPAEPAGHRPAWWAGWSPWWWFSVRWAAGPSPPPLCPGWRGTSPRRSTWHTHSRANVNAPALICLDSTTRVSWCSWNNKHNRHKGDLPLCHRCPAKTQTQLSEISFDKSACD